MRSKYQRSHLSSQCCQCSDSSQRFWFVAFLFWTSLRFHSRSFDCSSKQVLQMNNYLIWLIVVSQHWLSLLVSHQTYMEASDSQFSWFARQTCHCWPRDSCGSLACSLLGLCSEDTEIDRSISCPCESPFFCLRSRLWLHSFRRTSKLRWQDSHLEGGCTQSS